MTIATAAHATHHDEKRTKERCHTQRTRKLTRYRDTISLSRDITMMWRRQWWTHYCWEYINNVYNALHKITNISQRKYKSKDIEEYINRIGMTLCIDKRNKHNEEKVVIEKNDKVYKRQSAILLWLTGYYVNALSSISRARSVLLVVS